MRIRVLHFQISTTLTSIPANFHDQDQTEKSQKTRRTRRRNQRSPCNRQLRSHYAPFRLRCTLRTSPRQNPPHSPRKHRHLHHDPLRMHPFRYFRQNSSQKRTPHALSSRKSSKSTLKMEKKPKIKQRIHHPFPRQTPIRIPSSIRPPRCPRTYLHHLQQNHLMVHKHQRPQTRPRRHSTLPIPRTHRRQTRLL